MSELRSRYQKSLEFLKRSLAVVPNASQTFSKSRVHFPEGASPLFITRAKGSHTWDLDGNEYVDLVNGLCAITLGHGDPDVVKAVQGQLEQGVLFSLPHPLETEVSELLCELIPSAEAVRFGKNGSDVTSAAVRLARAHTGLDHVAVCGYHGWQDWYIGSTDRSLGVPESTKAMTHTFEYNNLDSLKTIFNQHKGKIACVIMEPYGYDEPQPGFLEGVRKLADQEEALLIFDEIVSGFRIAMGGAQEKYGVTPDLTAVGKGMANGFPISAIVGKKEIMELMNEVFFSFTAGGETLALAATKATLLKMREHKIPERLTDMGSRLALKIDSLLEETRMNDLITIAGHPTTSVLKFEQGVGSDVSVDLWKLKTLFLQEVLRRGILTLGAQNMCFAHTTADLEKVTTVYGEVFAFLRETIDQNKMDQVLQAEPLKPLFEVRGKK